VLRVNQIYADADSISTTFHTNNAPLRHNVNPNRTSGPAASSQHTLYAQIADLLLEFTINKICTVVENVILQMTTPGPRQLPQDRCGKLRPQIDRT